MENDKVYAEVYFFITQLPYSYKEALPKQLVNKLKENMSQEHFDKFDKLDLLINQNPTEKTIDFIISLSKYWVGKDDLEFLKDITYN